MRFEFLGTGGASITPRPGCACRVCAEARGRGVPFSRNGPSLFVHGPNLLIDTPEDVAHSLNRAGISQVGAVTWSHWHPDHTAGLRFLEMLNLRLWDWPARNACTPVYIPEGVWADFRRYHGLADRIDYLATHPVMRVIEPHVIPEGGSFTLDAMTVTPYRLPAPGAAVYAFILEQDPTRVLVAPDELVGWTPPADLGHIDLAILPTGVFEFHGLTGERLIPADHPVLGVEATFEQILAIVEALDCPRTIFVHIEEYDGHTYNDLLQLQRKLMQERPQLGSVMFAFDRLGVEG